jgi:cytidine deaminase
MNVYRKTLETSFELHENESSLNPQQTQLLIEAKKALVNAHAPYSQFNVGAAVLLDSGKIIWGSNQENMAYPSGLCAERVAFFTVGAQHPNEKILAVAITVKAHLFHVEQPLAPCGACRQAMLEFELKQEHPIQLVLQGETGSIAVIESVKSLLPLYFIEERLKKD